MPLPDELTPRTLPGLARVDLSPPYEGSPRRAVVVALLVPPVATGACGANGGSGGGDPHAFDCQVLLIRRSINGRHGGQIAMPGGEIEHGESPEEAGIRELREELGFDAADPAHRITFVGSLDPAYVPASDFLVQVLVAVAPETPAIHPEPKEVDEVLGAELGLFDPRIAPALVESVENGVALRYGAIPVPGDRKSTRLNSSHT